MPNNFGTLANSELVHDMMDELTNDLEPLLRLAVNLGDETADGGIVRALRPGSTVTITDWSKPFTPYAYSAAPGYVAPDYTAKNPVTVTLPTDWKACSMAITPSEWQVLNGAPRGGVAYNKLMEKARQMMLQGLKEAMITDFFALITAANYAANTVTAAGTYNRSKEIDVDTALFNRKLFSRANGTVILHPTAYGEWAKDLQTVQNYTGRDMSEYMFGGGGLTSGATAMRHWRTTVSLPAQAARGFAYTKTAAIFVNRIPNEPTYANDAVDLQEVVDPKTGFAFLSRLWKNPGTGVIQFDIATMWKFAKLQGEAIERLTAA